MRKYAIVAAAVLSLFGSVRLADAEVKLASPYIDPVRGFSLRPPADTNFSRITSANRLASWTMRKSPEAPILWRMSIYWRKDSAFKPGDNLLQFGRTLAEKLEKTEGFKAASPRVIEVAGTKALNLRGLTSGNVRFWQRRVWVSLPRARFLEVRVSGPDSDRQKLDEIATAVLKTLKLTDPKQAQILRKAALGRGTGLLKSITDSKLIAALDTSRQWYIYRREGKVIGFMRQAESDTTSSGKSGCRIQSWIMMVFDGRNVKLRRDMFASADRSIETWKETAVVRSAGKTVNMVEKGSKNGDRIDCEITVGDKSVKQKPIAAPADHYLPRAMAWLLRRLIDIKGKESSAFAFASYNGRKGSFNLRTFTVIGPEQVEVGGRKVDAIRVTDQLTAETQAADMWVDSNGNLLIMKTADGLIMETATENAVRRRFPDVDKTIKAMGR